MAVGRRPDYAVFLRLLEAADDAADQLEDAASLLGLRVLEGKAVDALQILADLLVEGAQEWIRLSATQRKLAAPRAMPRRRIS
ncbi:hypothetical protein [Methylocella tundrae]|uniref:hypothetical protein n=1 Tax=Methylocella tundrae TaxID=227605 RepID=UPI00106D05F9|nr:hypothetical protein [Methylocella tundrae]